MRKPWLVLLLGSMLLVGLTGCGDKGGEGEHKTTDIKTLIETKCSTCHFSSRIFDTKRPAEEWKDIVRRMHSKNPEMISREETKRIVKYLMETNSLPGDGTDSGYVYDPEWDH